MILDTIGYCLEALLIARWSLRLRRKSVPWHTIVPLMLLAPMSDMCCKLHHHGVEHALRFAWFILTLLFLGGGGGGRRRRRVTPKAEARPRTLLPRILLPGAA